MDKKLDAVRDSFEEWLHRVKKINAGDRTTRKLVHDIEGMVLEFLIDKRKKYVKIETMNKMLFGEE